MTGFGKVTAELPSKKVTVEIKALNSKQLDLSTRIPSIYKEKEMQIRSLLLQSLERGKVEFNIFVEYIGKDTPTQINLAAVENYYNQIKDIADRLNIGLPADWFQTLLRMPDVIKTEAQEVNEEEWNVVEKAIKEAIGHLCDFRIQEGAMLQKLFEQKIANISRLLSEVEQYEKERIEKIMIIPHLILVLSVKQDRKNQSPYHGQSRKDCRTGLRQEPVRTGDDLLYRKTGCKRGKEPPGQPPEILHQHDGERTRTR